MQDYYCERLAVGYIVGTYWLFKPIFTLGLACLNEKTKAKLVYVSDSNEEMAAWYEPDQLLVEYGGTMNLNFDYAKMWGL